MGIFNFKGFKLTPEGRRVEKVIEDLSKLEVAIGYTADSGTYEDGTTLVEVALFNEYGTVNMPSRPFIRGTYWDNEAEIKAFIKKTVANGIAKKEDAHTIMSKIGVYAKGLMQKEIKDGAWAPNAPSTIKSKKSSQPLIDTARMRQSIVYIVREKGS